MMNRVYIIVYFNTSIKKVNIKYCFYFRTDDSKTEDPGTISALYEDSASRTVADRLVAKSLKQLFRRFSPSND